jgi:predicted nucleic acid-binding Zn ribbon protein
MNSFQQLSENTGQQASRFVKPVPRKLAELIMLANLAPPGYAPPDPPEIVKIQWCLSPDCPDKERCDLQEIEVLEDFLRDAPAKLREYVWQVDPQSLRYLRRKWIGLSKEDADFLQLSKTQAEEIDYLVRSGNDPVTASESVVGRKADPIVHSFLSHENRFLPAVAETRQWVAFKRYKAFWHTYQTLHHIAVTVKTLSQHPSPEYLTERFLNVGWINYRAVDVYIDDGGFFRVRVDEFLEAIDGVEASRVRSCEVCGIIFWAGRRDQLCCSTKCARVLRTRRWRARYYHVGEKDGDDGYKLRRQSKS